MLMNSDLSMYPVQQHYNFILTNIYLSCAGQTLSITQFALTDIIWLIVRPSLVSLRDTEFSMTQQLVCDICATTQLNSCH